MKIRVKLFAAAKEMAGSDALAIEVPDGARIADVRQAVVRDWPALRTILLHSQWAVNAAFATDETAITQQSEVALIPPVSGG